MPKYLIEASYNSEGAKGVQSAGGTARVEAVRKATEGVGGSVESFHFAFGDTDAYVIVDAPDVESIAALALAVNASGKVTVKTTVLLTAEQVDDAARRSVGYAAPGS
ncbi:MAG: GYD domain-containing protein [Solirubrobacteraceae bacterium]